MEKANNWVELTKALAWPLIAVLAMLTFHGDISWVARHSEEMAFGAVKFKQHVEAVDEELKNITAANTDLADSLKEVAKSQEVPSDQKERIQSAVKALDSITSRVAKERSTLKAEAATLPASKPAAGDKQAPGKDYGFASSQEDLGFLALAEQNREQALAAFGKAEENWPGFHNVAEIISLLKGKPEAAGKDPAVWVDIYKTILERYSWGMDSGQRKKFRDYLKEHKPAA